MMPVDDTASANRLRTEFASAYAMNSLTVQWLGWRQAVRRARVFLESSARTPRSDIDGKKSKGGAG